MQDAVLQVGLLREQAVDEARQPDGAVVVTERDDAVGERRVARVGERRRPRVGAAAEARELEARACAGRTRRPGRGRCGPRRGASRARAPSRRAPRASSVTSSRAKLSFSRAAGGVGSGAARFSHTVADGNAATSGSSAGAFGALCFGFERGLRLRLLGQRRTRDVRLHDGDLLGRSRGRARHGPRDGRGGRLGASRAWAPRSAGRAPPAARPARRARRPAQPGSCRPRRSRRSAPEAPVAPVAAGVDPSSSSSEYTPLPAPAESASPAQKMAQKERVCTKRRVCLRGSAGSVCSLRSSHSSQARPRPIAVRIVLASEIRRRCWINRLVKDFRRGIAFCSRSSGAGGPPPGRGSWCLHPRAVRTWEHYRRAPRPPLPRTRELRRRSPIRGMSRRPDRNDDRGRLSHRRRGHAQNTSEVSPA